MSELARLASGTAARARRAPAGATGLALALAAAAACGEADRGILAPGTPVVRVVVLNSVGKTYDVLDLDARGLPAARRVVNLPDNYDGTTFDVAGGIAVTAASELQGSWLFVTDLLGAGTTHAIDFPDLDDLAGVRFRDASTAYVAARGAGFAYRLDLRDSSVVAFTDTVAQSPYLAVPIGDRLYLVDANQDRTTFATLGPSRVVVASLATGRALDTVPLAGFGATAAEVAGSKLLVLEGGSFPNPEAALAVVDLSGPAPAVREYAVGGFGLWLEVGLDGRAYVTAVPDPSVFETKVVYVFDPATEQFVRGPGDPLPLARPDGTPASCWAATAADDGRVFCAEDRGAANGLLYVYGAHLKGQTSIGIGLLPTDLWVAALR
jgi:hypothetical protein